MPQENYPYTVTTNDSVYTIQSDGEFYDLPDSIKQIVPVELLPSTPKSYEVSPEFLIGAFILIAIIIYKSLQAIRQIEEERVATEKAEQEQAPVYTPQCLIYKGEELKFSKEEMHRVCSKYNPFYHNLGQGKQAIFINRLKAFMYRKDFYIMSPQGYKEMPLLISAAAIQVSFGLDEYHFPYFTRIIIHPEEYIAYDPLRILVGNVQGRSITISWKHFLSDYENPTDGKNVGLHEMAHALQVQHLFKNYGYQSDFKDDYEHYDKIDDEVLLAERLAGTDLFDENALISPNEFWATCVELFFEKPAQLKLQYPKLYSGICVVLNQDPCNT